MPQPILFAIPLLDAGGPDRVIYELLCGLPRDRISPHLLVSRRGGRYFDALPADVTVHSLDSDARYPFRAFAAAVDRIAPALVMTTLRMNVAGGLARYFQKRRVPLVARQANAIAADFAILKSGSLVKHRIAELVVRHALRRADAVVAQSIDMGAELQKELAPRQRLDVIGNPVSLAEISAKAAAQTGSATVVAGTPAIVSVGRLMAQKGYDLLLPAFAQVLAAHPEARLTLLGEGPDRAALEARAAALGIDHAVAMPGQSDAVFAELAAADLFVSSSRYEGFSNAILEAMALGVPVAATDCPGATREMILDGETGMLAAEITTDSIADAVLRALAADRKALGEAGRAHVAAQFDKAAIIGRYADLFDELIAAAQA